MKIKAFILLLSLSVYYLDIATALDVCEMLEQNAVCCEEDCTDKTAELACSADDVAGPSSGDECPPSSADGCCKYCITCPQAYITILPGTPAFHVPFTLVKKQFPVLQDDRINGFFAVVWQPPDGRLFH